MKKRFFILLTLITISLKSFAGDIKVINRGATFNVLYRSDLVCDTKITILDADGNEIFREVIQGMCNIVRSYNFSKLPFGDYEIKASNTHETQKTKINYRAPLTDKVHPLFHVTKLNENKYLLMVPKSEHDNIAISISDNNSRVLYAKRETTEGDFARVFFIKNADPNDAVTFSVKSVK